MIGGPNTHRVFFPHFVASARIEFPAPTAECAVVQFWIFFSLPSRNTTEHAPIVHLFYIKKCNFLSKTIR